MRIVFIGPPGSGKGTQAQRLEQQLGIVHLSTGDMLRDSVAAGSSYGLQAAHSMQTGKLVTDDVVIGIVAERLDKSDCTHGCLFDGFPRTVPQAETLDKLLAQRGTKIDLVLELKVEPEHLVNRLLSRGRADDQMETIGERFREYDRLTSPLVEYYRRQGILRSINGDAPEEVVFAQIQSVISELQKSAD
jgi:adenylate kinase